MSILLDDLLTGLHYYVIQTHVNKVVIPILPRRQWRPSRLRPSIKDVKLMKSELRFNLKTSVSKSCCSTEHTTVLQTAMRGRVPSACQVSGLSMDNPRENCGATRHMCYYPHSIGGDDCSDLCEWRLRETKQLDGVYIKHRELNHTCVLPLL